MQNTPNPCQVCGCTDVNLTDGYYYCTECGTQNTEMRETIVEKSVLELTRGEFAIARKTRIRQEKVTIEMSEEWKIWHAFNFIMSNMADEVISLGAPPTFKAKLLWIWTKYIKKFHQKDEVKQINTKKNKFLAQNEEDDAESESDSEKSEQEDVETILKKKDNMTRYDYSVERIKRFNMYIVFAMIYAALNLDGSDIQLSDLLRWEREGRLSFKESIKYLPEDLDVWTIKAWSHFINSAYDKIKSIDTIRSAAVAIFDVLDIGTPRIPNLTDLLMRYCKELCLPKEFREVALSVLNEVVYPDSKLLQTSAIPNFEVIVMGCIVIGLKMCFGLDDDYDTKLSFYVDEINEEQQHLKAYRIGRSEPTERLFCFRDWLVYLEYRKQIIAKYFYPVAYLHHIGVNDTIGVEALKDYFTARRDLRLRPWNVKKAIDRVQYDLLKNIPIKGEYKVIPKEEFPVSLTPMTSYTVFLIQRIENAEDRLILTEDFSKYSLKYACVDFDLKSSEICDNLIIGVSSDKKNVTKKVEAEKNNWYPQPVPEVFVINYDYEDWVKDYRDGEDDEETNEEQTNTESEVKIEDVKHNGIEELEECSNIFTCDAKTDIESMSSSRNTAPMDTRLDDFDNFENPQPLLEQFDPHYFNREELIEKLVIDACRDFKIPIPYEYRPSRPVVIRRNNSNEAKVRQVHNYQMSQSDILKTYKSMVEAPDPPLLNENENYENLNDSKQDIELQGPLEPPSALSPIPDDKSLLNMTMDVTPNITVMEINESEPINAETLNETTLNETNLMETSQTNPMQTLLQDWEEDVDSAALDEVMNKVYLEEPSQEPEQPGKILRLRSHEGSEETEADAAKLIETREYFDALLKENLDIPSFKYYLKFYHRNDVCREHKVHALLLNDMPNSLRVVLENCSTIIEYPVSKLFSMMQRLEVLLFSNYTKTEVDTELTRDLPSEHSDSDSDDGNDDQINDKD